MATSAVQTATPPTNYSRGLLRVVPPGQLDAAEKARDEQLAAAKAAAQTPIEELSGLAGHIRTQFEVFKQHRNITQSGWNDRLLAAMRAFKNQYDATKMAEINKFGGSAVYSPIIATKCRATSSLLRDVYLAPERPWSIEAPVDPPIPQNIIDAINKLVQSEIQTTTQAGQPPDVNAIRDRVLQLMSGARDAAKKRAKQQASIAEEKIDEILTEGGFYIALAEFLVDLPLFPYACIKGPEVRIVPSVDWSSGRAVVKQKPKLFWSRVSPFDVWWTPGVARIEDADIVERIKVTRADLNDLLDLPGYQTDEVRAVLDEYGRGGIADNWDTTDAERAVMESRENPQFNRSGLISCLLYTGNVQGRMLLQYGFKPEQVPDPMRDYFVQGWLIGRHIIKVQLAPSPRKRHPYFVTSFEKVPGTPVGNALPDIIGDLADVCNATLRSMVNNLSIASGPQCVVNDDRLSADEDGEDLYPWKRWHVTSDPMGNNTQEPISFFQPNSIAQELLAVYDKISSTADDISAIPKYVSGGPASGGAGRTASGLAMLMGNASKILQTVAANIDRDIFEQLLGSLFDMLMLTDTSGMLTGEENIRVMGVAVAVQRETQRSRQLEYLQITANPVDMQIIGPKGRAPILRAVAQGIGLDGEKIVPSDEEMEEQQKQHELQQAQMAATNAATAGGQAQGNQPGNSSTGDMGPRTNSQQQRPQPVGGGVG
jgi:hypothetical protein